MEVVTNPESKSVRQLREVENVFEVSQTLARSFSPLPNPLPIIPLALSGIFGQSYARERTRGRGGGSTTQSVDWMQDNLTFSDAVTRAGTTKYLQEIKTIKKQSIENVPIKKTVRNQVFQVAGTTARLFGYQKR